MTAFVRPSHPSLHQIHYHLYNGWCRTAFLDNFFSAFEPMLLFLHSSLVHQVSGNHLLQYKWAKDMMTEYSQDHYEHSR